jgi:hypothetical protein
MWFLLYIIISSLIIYIGHQFWIYSTQSFVKKRYMVGSQIDKYKSIIEELQFNKDESNDIENDLEEFMKGVI